MTTRMLSLSLVLLSLLGCDPPPTAIPPGEAQSVSAAPPPPPAPPPARPIDMSPDAAPAPSGPGGPPASGGGTSGAGVGSPRGGGTASAGGVVAPPRGAVGSACDTAADCETGVCEGEGCDPGRGRCAAKNRSCTRDRRAYCGCDGNTFYSSGSCPGRRFASRGICGAAGGGGGGAKLAADGAACKVAGDCESGICEGQGCGEGTLGVCVSKKRPCTADLRAYCGCDGVTFRASSSCPGRRYAARSECKK